MSLRKGLRAMQEARLKEIRDRNARDDYVRMEGRAEGKAEDILQLLAQKGAVSSELEGMIRGQRDLELLNRWLLSAARTENVEAFASEAGLRIEKM